jgi:uncharacterized protein YecT (DUF1311 family)
MWRAAFLLFAISTSIPAVAQRINQPDNPCAASASTREMSDCLVLAWEAQDGKLNTFYGEVLPVLTEDEAKALREAERIWIRYRDATCDAEKSLYGGGTGGPPAYLACMEAVTRNRLQELHQIYDWVLRKRRDEVQPKPTPPEPTRVP